MATGCAEKEQGVWSGRPLARGKVLRGSPWHAARAAEPRQTDTRERKERPKTPSPRHGARGHRPLRAGPMGREAVMSVLRHAASLLPVLAPADMRAFACSCRLAACPQSPVHPAPRAQGRSVPPSAAPGTHLPAARCFPPALAHRPCSAPRPRPRSLPEPAAGRADGQTAATVWVSLPWPWAWGVCAGRRALGSLWAPGGSFGLDEVSTGMSAAARL